jgi:large subunit ribosomal protein L35
LVVGKRKKNVAKMKLKNHSGASKRFKRTGSGKWMRRKAGMRHILTSKAPGRKAQLRGAAEVSKEDQYSLSRLLPYK